MSSSSSDSDSDDFEPIRKIKINIRPKEDATRKGAADVSEIKASVEAWRPLGPPTHRTLSRRQSSLSSVSSISFGTGSIGCVSSNGAVTSSNNAAFNNAGIRAAIHSSPSCSSLVNEFNNRSSFSNFMSTKTSRTSSPLASVNSGDAIPIAIAIQESIELIVKSHYDPNAIEPKFNSRFFGNIKVAFPNAFVRGNYGKPSSGLVLRMNSTENIIKYYASRLIKDLNLGTNLAGIELLNEFSTTGNDQIISSSTNGDNNESQQVSDAFDPFTSKPRVDTQLNTQLVEFDMDTLMEYLRKMYEQSPTSRYFNVDVLRYQIRPICSIEECPLQVCAYWKIETDLVKLRIDFTHSSKCRLNVENLRDITFTVNFANLIPAGIDINSLSPDSVSSLRLNNNNNSGTMNMNDLSRQSSLVSIETDNNSGRPKVVGDHRLINNRTHTVRPLQRHNLLTTIEDSSGGFDTTSCHRSQQDSSGATREWHTGSNQRQESATNNRMPPCITFEPCANWNGSIKQLTWKFDTFISHYKTDELGSLFAKLDFRNSEGMPSQFLENCRPPHVNVKFLVVDSTLSNMSVNVDSIGYKMSLLKKEIRSGRYMSEPYLVD